MTIEYTNHKFDHYSIDVSERDINFATMFFVVKNMFHNDDSTVKRYINIISDEIKRR